jgi:HD-like signal output (HDOD) protein
MNNETTSPFNPDLPDPIEKQMRMEIRQIGIPPCPTVIIEIDREFSKAEPDFSLLSKVISSDVGLSATLIKTTNSPFFGFSKKVRTVPEALLVLGLRLIVQTIAGLSLQKVFQHVPHMDRFWASSATMARVSGWLATRLRNRCGVRPEDAYTFGLFRDCGIPVLMIPFPDYRDILRQANEEQDLSFTAVEDRLISINHATVGADLAETWLLPDEIIHAIRHHHDLALAKSPESPVIPAVSWTMIAIAQLAEHLIQLKTGLALTHEWGKAIDIVQRELGLTSETLATLEYECESVLTE